MPIGKEVWFSVRADLMNTGDKQDMANRVEGKYIASEFLGSLETDVFEVAPGQYVHVEQHRHAQDRIYKMGDREMLCWPAEAGFCSRIRAGRRRSMRPSDPCSRRAG